MFGIPEWLADWENRFEQQWKRFAALDGDFCLRTHTFKVKTFAVCQPARGLPAFHLPCFWPGMAYFLIPSTNDIGGEDTDLLWPSFPAVNEHVGTADHLARDTQIAADSRSNGSLITRLCS